MRDQPCSQTKSCNEDYEDDLNYTLEMCRWLLRPLGMWTLVYHRVSKLEKALAMLLQIASFSSLLFVILPSAYNMFFVEEDLKKVVKLLGPVSFCTSSTIKYFILGLKGNILGRCIKHLEKDWKMVKDPYHRAIMLKQVSISRFLITVCVAFLYSGGMSYHTVMQFLSKGNTNTNVTFRPIAYPCFKFLDIQSSPTYEIVFFLHCVSALVQYTITSAGYSMAAIFITHICGQIQIQISRLDELVNDIEKKSTLHHRISIIVRDHAEVIRFSKDVDEALREVCLTQIAESTLNMCMLEYYSLTQWNNSDMIAILTYIMLLVSFTFNIFIFCYIGENLSEQVFIDKLHSTYSPSVEIFMAMIHLFIQTSNQCSRMGPASYDVPWYNLPPGEAYNLILVNAVAQYPPKLTAGKIMDLSISTFGTLVAILSNLFTGDVVFCT